MMDFIYKLYQNDNFTTILVVTLIVLILLFIIVLLAGKKDKKLEETRKLQKIELEKSMPKSEETFKEVKEEPVKLETKQDEKFFDDTNALPTLNSLLNDKKEEVSVTVFEPTEEIVQEHEEPSVEPVSFDFDDNKMESDLNELESLKNEFNNISIPKIEEEKVVPVTEEKPKEVVEERKVNPSPQVFSSVFVGNNANNIEESKKEVSQNKPLFTIVDDDEDTIELPTLNSDN